MKVFFIIISICILTIALAQHAYTSTVAGQIIVDTLPPIPYNNIPAPNNPVNGNGNTLPLPDTSRPQMMPDTLHMH